MDYQLEQRANHQIMNYPLLSKKNTTYSEKIEKTHTTKTCMRDKKCRDEKEMKNTIVREQEN